MVGDAYRGSLDLIGLTTKSLFGRSIAMFNRRLSTNWKLYGVAIIFIVGLLTIWRDNRSIPSIIRDQNQHLNQHPIERMITYQRKHFEDLQARQSESFPAAVDEYQRRYGREPPAGFEYWFNLAQRHEFVLIDEFDTFMHSLEPFHGVAPHMLRQRMQMVFDEAEYRLATLEIEDGQVSMTESLFVGLSGMPDKAWLQNIPYNMTLLLNSFDEAMVAVPWEDLEDALANPQKEHVLGDADDSSRPFMKSTIGPGRQRGWAATSHACPPQSVSRQSECSDVLQDGSLPFVQNTTRSMDVCHNCNIIDQHGMLIHPENLITAHELVPIWSASKPSHFHDILYPSCYYGAVRQDYHAELDPFWDEKDNKFYWVGSSTGGHADEENWRQMQRQRLVLKFARDDEQVVQVLKETRSGTWIPEFVPMAQLAEEFFDVRLVNVVQCEPEVCVLEEAAFGITNETIGDAKDEAHKHKFVIDVDGNAFSGRFYRLLQSRSVVIKQTIFKEWHDDRLIPWVHYVPLSIGYEELPEMARFLAGTEQGLKLSHRIAQESTRWHNVALRDVDLKITMLRMLLEYGRLMSSDK